MTPQTNYRYCSNCGKPLFLVKHKWYTALLLSLFSGSHLYTVAVMPTVAVHNNPPTKPPKKMGQDLPTCPNLPSLQVFMERCKRAGIEMPDKVKELFIKECIDNG
jgi:hypothetical protein